MESILVTGGMGFIGSNFVEFLAQTTSTHIYNVDALTYAGNPQNLQNLSGRKGYEFIHADIREMPRISEVLKRSQPDWIVHFAAESHVDRSISGPSDFIKTNIEGTFNLLESARRYWEKLAREKQKQFRFLHVSTDEVYGSLGASDPAFTEATPYAPNSPYSATKASSDHLVRAYFHTYGLPVLTTNCSNNYGPYQFPEKLVPLVIHNALEQKPLPIYGDGSNVRDWLYVLDHCRAILGVLSQGDLGETYNVGGNSEKQNVEVVNTLCDLLDELHPKSCGESYRSQIEFVRDRPGHDQRYAVNATKIRDALGWEPIETFESGMRKTVQWYLANSKWVENVTSGAYREWVETQFKK